MAEVEKESETPSVVQNGGETEESLEKELALLSDDKAPEDENALKKAVSDSASMPPPAQSAADRMRNLRVENLPLGILYDKENMEQKVRELFQGAFSLPEDGVEAVNKIPVMEDGKEKSCYVVVTFKSRVHRNRCFTQRSKLSDPISVAPDTDEQPKPTSETTPAEKQGKETPVTEEQEAAVVNNENENNTENMEFVVEDEITIEEEEETTPAKMEETDGDVQVVENGETTTTTEGTEKKTPEGEAKTDEKNEENTQSSIAPSGTTPAKSGAALQGDGASKPGEDEHMEHEEEEGKDKATFRVDWYGAPEFQWRTISNPMERSKITVENVSLGDLTNPFLYNAVLRARGVNFDCVQNNRHGEFEHAILRKGRLVLSFVSDSQAMSTAVNSLVFVRTRENRRLKVFLPQTPSTLKMSHLLERKLGQITDPPARASQLMIRDIGSEATEDMVKEAVAKFAQEERIEKITIEEDSFKRRCGVVTFKDPQTAVMVHMKADELQIGEKERWCKVFHMQDILPGCLLMRPEQNLEKRKQFLTDSADKSKRSHSKTNKKEEAKSGDKAEDGDSKKRKLEEDGKKDDGEKELPEGATDKQEGKKDRSGSPDRKKAKSGGPAAALSSSWKDKGKDTKSPRGGMQNKSSPRGKGGAPMKGDRSRGGKTFPEKGRGRGGRGGSSFSGGSFRGLERGGRGSDRGFRGGRGGNRGGRGDFSRSAGYNRNSQQSYGRTPGGGSVSQPWLSSVNSAPAPRGYRDSQSSVGMEQVLKQQQQQLEYQQQLLRQQDIINQLADELSTRSRTSGLPAAVAPSPYGGSQGTPYNGPGAGVYGSPSGGSVYGSGGSYPGGGRYGRR